jgi:hypothetical protein
VHPLLWLPSYYLYQRLAQASKKLGDSIEQSREDFRGRPKRGKAKKA